MHVRNLNFLNSLCVGQRTELTFVWHYSLNAVMERVVSVGRAESWLEQKMVKLINDELEMNKDQVKARQKTSAEKFRKKRVN